MKFSTIHRYIRSALHQCSEEVCKDGYAALLQAQDMAGLADVVRRYWADLNHTLWPVFSQLMQKYYEDCRPVFVKYGICYNESTATGLCVVDEFVRGEVVISGTASAEVHGDASVTVTGSAEADLHDTASAQAQGQSRVSAWDESSVHATQRSTIRAFGSSHVIADGAVTAHLSDDASIKVIRAFRIYDSRNS